MRALGLLRGVGWIHSRCTWRVGPPRAFTKNSGEVMMGLPSASASPLKPRQQETGADIAFLSEGIGMQKSNDM